MLKMIQKICLVAILLSLGANVSANRLKKLLIAAESSDQAVKKVSKDADELKRLQSELTDVLGKYAIKKGDKFQWETIFIKMDGAIDNGNPSDAAEVFKRLQILIERSEDFSAAELGNPLKLLLLKGENLLYLKRAKNGDISFNGDISQSLFPLGSDKWKSLADEAAEILKTSKTVNVALKIGEIFALQSDRLLYIVNKIDVEKMRSKELNALFDRHISRIKTMTSKEQIGLFPDITRTAYILRLSSNGVPAETIGEDILIRHIELAKDNARLEELVMSLDGLNNDVIDWVQDVLSRTLVR